MAARIKSFSKTFVWILLGLLIAGLAGFGALNLSGTVRTVATVGDQTVSVDQYARELQREVRAVEAQTGQPMQLSQIRDSGLDRAVLARLIALASLDNEVDRIGISVGDANLQKEIVEIPAFQGPDGKFDRDSYKFQLEQAGLNETEFETDLRAEAARTLVQGAIVAGVAMPSAMTDTLVDYVAARRSFTMAVLTAQALPGALPDPSADDLRAWYDAHPDRYVLPETKRITYALLGPEMVIDQVEPDEDAVRRLYAERSDEFDIPERRLVERLVFADETAAKDAKAQLEVGGTTFEKLVEDRGLGLADVDMGDVTADDLGAAGGPVFAAETGEVVGPLPSDLGPALFRVNGKLAARLTDFEDAAPELRDELAGERARRMIEARAENINDLLAGGATLEDLAAEAGMELGHVDWSEEASEGIAAYDAFRSAAQAVTAGDYPEAAFLEDGGLFALRLDEVLPERPQPFEDAREKVIADWTLAQTETALRKRADEVLADLEGDGDFASTGLDVRSETGLTRSAYLEDTPPDLMTQVFQMEPGELRIVAAGVQAIIVRLDEVLPPDQSAELTAMRQAIAQQMNQALGQALFDAYVYDAQTLARPMLDQQALNAVQANFR
ncbi:MAG: peptidyl-prolyl cis-trans isomerase [Jhaorihella sp.]